MRSLWREYLINVLGWSEQNALPRIEEEVTGAMTARMLAYLESQGWDFANKVVIDVGCGTGALIGSLPGSISCAVGVELGSAFSRAAKLRVRGLGYEARFLIVRGDGAQIPMKSGTVDLAFCLQVLEHVPEPGHIIREIARVLKPGGHAVLNFENYLSFFEPHYRVRWFPMLPKPLGAIYLRWLGRDPAFLLKHIRYTIGIKEALRCYEAGLISHSCQRLYEKLVNPERAPQPFFRWFASWIGSWVSARTLRKSAFFFTELRRLFQVNYTLELEKQLRAQDVPGRRRAS